MRIVEELLGSAREEDLSLLDEVGAVDDGEDLTGVVVGDEDANPLLLEKADERFEVGDGEGVDVGEGFVEKEKRGLGG